jgi:hypothetical protein
LRWLEAEVAALKAQREVPTSITRCMVRLDGVWITPDAALDEITRLRADLAQRTAERDEARREVCELRAVPYKPTFKRQIAIERGWDCFKKEEKR